MIADYMWRTGKSSGAKFVEVVDEPVVGEVLMVVVVVVVNGYGTALCGVVSCASLKVQRGQNLGGKKVTQQHGFFPNRICSR